MAGVWDGDLTPSEAVQRNFWFCTIDDPTTLRVRDRIGVDHIMVESDYPHADSSWPDTQALLAERFAGLPAADVAKLTHENAARLFRHPLPPEWVCRGLVTEYTGVARAASARQGRGAGRRRHRIFGGAAGCPPESPLAVITINSTATTEHATPRVDESTFDLYVELEADELATPEQLGGPRGRPAARARASLLRLLIDADEHLVAARRLPGEERDQVVADAEHLHRQLTAALFRLTGERRSGGAMVSPSNGSGGARRARGAVEPGGRAPAAVVGTGPGGRLGRRPRLPDRRRRRGGQVPGRRRGPRRTVGRRTPTSRSRVATRRPRSRRRSARCSGGWSPPAPARCATTSARACAGWARSRCGRSSSRHAARWSRVLRQRRRRSGSSRSEHASYAVRWTPALVDPDRLADVVDAMPGSVAALDPSVDARAVTRSALTGMVDAIGRDSARRIEVPAAPPVVRTGNDVTEAFLARLDGSAFDAPVRVAGELVVHAPRVGRARSPASTPPLDRAPRPARPHRRVGPRGVRRQGARRLEGQGARPRRARHRRRPARKRADLEHELARLERMLPALLRGRQRPPRPGRPQPGRGVGAHDRSPARASPPPASTCASPSSRTRKRHADAAGVRRRRRSPPVGANQLADVRWSAVFDDVELTAAEIRALANEARPLIRSGGQLGRARPGRPRAAAAALAERADTTQLTGAEMLRLALGLEGSPLAGGITRRRRRLGGRPARRRRRRRPANRRRRPKGFVGELRSYQAEALAWLGFLDAGRPRRLPRPRHGPGQDAHHARPPARAAPATAPRW